ncbi:MAG: hypothetical protein U1C48_09540 [Methylotenera sp.]|nr:hypothetical protein [Methylotenera sp.]
MNKVYVKTVKAVNEFEQGNRTLSLKHRQILMMVDGKRTNSELANFFSSRNAIQMLLDLEKLGFLMSSDAAKNQPVNNQSNPTKPIEDSLSLEHLTFIKTFLVEEARMQLGLMSREIEKKIVEVQNSDDLKTCIARWHMAIRDSRNGRTVSDKLMERLTHLLANPPHALASEMLS